MNTIGTLGEKSLHADLKEWYAQPGDETEVLLDGYHIDLVRGDQLIEIQTANFSAIKRKLAELLVDHRVRLVYPIARRRWILRVDVDGSQVSRRKSPKKGTKEDLFDQLVSIALLAANPNLTIEILFIEDEIVWKNDGLGSWRRKGWSVADRRLIKVLDSTLMEWPSSYLSYISPKIETGFTNLDLAKTAGMKVTQARKVTYCLNKMGLISCTGHRERYKLYARTDAVDGE